MDNAAANALSRPWDDPRIAAGMKTQLARRRALLAAGEAALGWKFGLGAPAAMEKLGLRNPLIGYLLKRALLPSGAEVSLKGWVKPVAEPEIAVHMGKDLPAGADAVSVAAAIAGLGPAIELGDMDIAPESENIEAILAGDIYQRNVVLGPADTSRAGGRLAGLRVRALRNGVEVATTTDPEANIGKILDLVRHLADTLDAFGERLRAGDVIITGAAVPFLVLGPADRSLAHKLDPIGEVSLRFSW